VSTQELTYPQKSCCAATAWASRIEPSGFALINAKLLISFKSRVCQQNEQPSASHAESRLWVTVAGFAHKVIHKICGQTQKRIPIIDLGAFSQMKPSFRPQLDMSQR
jgi:hypothetical protein